MGVVMRLPALDVDVDAVATTLGNLDHRRTVGPVRAGVKENRSPTLLKAVVFGAVIAVVRVVARHAPALGGWLAALPLIGFLWLAWLAIDGRTGAERPSSSPASSEG